MRPLLLALFACLAGGTVAAREPAPSIRHELVAWQLARGEAKLHHFAIPLAGTQVSYVDLKYETPLIEALGAHDVLLNGGYWGYRGQQRVIEGLLIVDDRRLSPAHPGGGVLALRAGAARIVRGDQYSAAPGTALALQCSPRLVDSGEIIPKLESKKRAPRTAVCVREQRGELSAYLSEDAITLAELATFLRAQGCREALNLDGGPSTAAAARLPEGIVTVGRGLALPYGIAFDLQPR